MEENGSTAKKRRCVQTSTIGRKEGGPRIGGRRGQRQIEDTPHRGWSRRKRREKFKGEII